MLMLQERLQIPQGDMYMLIVAYANNIKCKIFHPKMF